MTTNFFIHESNVTRFKDVLNLANETEIAAIEGLQSSIRPDSCYNIQFTSGTTGKPKAARMAHFSSVNNGYDMGACLLIFFDFWSEMRVFLFVLGVRQELNKHYRRICVNNPLFHGYGIIITIMNCLNHGTTMVLPSPHFNPEDSLKTIVNEKCDICYGTPTSKYLLTIKFV